MSDTRCEHLMQFINSFHVSNMYILRSFEAFDLLERCEMQWGMQTLLPSCHRVRVICASPCGRSTRLNIGRANLNNGAIGSANHQEGADDNDEDGPSDHQLPLHALVLLRDAPVVVQPHETHWLERHESSQESADERDKTSEDGNCAGDNVRGQNAAAGAA